MNELAQMIYQIGNTSSRLDKVAMLKSCKDVPGFKEVLQFIYNPYVRTGIAETKLAKLCHGQNVAHTWQEVISYFSRNQTGNNTDVAFAWEFINNQTTSAAKNLAIAIVTKTLKIGVTETTLNQVYGQDFIPKIGVMLGSPYEDNKEKVKGPFVVTEKLDGHRRILVKENGTCSFYSRNGLPDEGLVDIEKEAELLPDNMVYDGECLAIGNFKNALDLRQATNSIMNRKGTRTGVTFNIFDAVPLHEFKQGISKEATVVRKCLVAAIFNDESVALINKAYADAMKNNMLVQRDFEFIKSVPILGVVNTDEEIMALAQPIWNRGFEGVMLNQVNSKYEIKRSKQLLKVKDVKSLDLPIVDFQEGTGKYIGMLGAFIVEYRGCRVGVGSGLTDSDRVRYWNMKSELLGKKIEIDTFGETTNQDGGISLNAPIFKGVRWDK